MAMVSVDKWKVLWEVWDLRVVILTSLSLQILLIFLAPLRKRVSTVWINMPLWLAYLLADSAATYAVGLISRSQGDTFGPFALPTLPAFWGPFLLVHLGGQDTITAFALEDNELWLRHLLSLGTQSFLVGYTFFQSLSLSNHKFWIPTCLMFVAGFYKYGERICALYLASSRRFKESLLTKLDPGPNYAKLMDEYTSKKEAKLPTKIIMIPEPPSDIIKTKNLGEELNDLKVVKHAHEYFDIFKRLIADLIFTIPERNQSRDYFLNRSPKDAFKIVQVELNFFYEMLYTKATVVQGIGEIRFRDTCAEAKKFFRERKIEKSNKGNNCCLFFGDEPKQGQGQGQTSCCFSKCCSKEEKGWDKLHEQACKSISAVETEVPPIAVKGDRSKSVLFDASIMAQKLNEIKPAERRWKIISKVWVELLSYSAGHCRADAHMAQLSKGGELLTFVWLLMAHLGLGDVFQIREGHARAKLIVTK